MLQRCAIILFLIAILAVISACAAPPVATTTLMPPNEPVASMAITQTAPFAQEVATTVPAARGTLPPTWTPFFIETLTPTQVTLVPDLTSQALLAQPTLSNCESFVFDRTLTPRTFISGQPVTITWGAPLGAANYRVTLLNQALEPQYTDLTTATSFTFAGDLFVFGGFYGWEVRPYDISGVQFCLPIGGELTMATG